jgi:beta-glucosidase
MKHKEIIVKMSLEDKVAFCSGADFWSTKALEQYAIPSIILTDGPHGLRKQVAAADNLGLNRSVPSTCFPTASATACSWDRGLLREMGEALGEEARQEGVSIILGPAVNIQRNPLGGRNFDYFSEDPYLAGEMAASWIQGVQSQGVGVAIKHFAGNNQEKLRMTSDSLIDERALREIYLPAFEKAVKAARPAAVMCAYNKLNGTYCSDNSYLLRDILRIEWGYEGVILTDWGAMNDRVKAFEAGLDLEMPGGVGYYDRAVLAAIQSGELPEEKLDESVDRLLELVLSAHANQRVDYHAHHALARKIAANSAVLLKNQDHLLPIGIHQKIALIGALAQNPRYQGTGSSIINPTQLSSLMDGFEEQKLEYSYYPGYSLKGPISHELVEEAVAGAKGSDVAVILAGLTAEYEIEGLDRTDLSIPESHTELINRVAAANPNTVVVLVGGAPVEMPWLPKVKAVLNMLLAGQAGGLAAAELLTGKVNPSGKLAATYPVSYADVPSAGFYEAGGRQAQYRESIYVGYRYYEKARQAVLFPFGHGLSYTSFEYHDLILSKTEMRDTDQLTAGVTIKNTGPVDGAEIVQLYVSDLQPGGFRPVKELRDFTKVVLRAGEEKQIEFVLNFRSFACYDPAAKSWSAPEGNYQISIGASSRDIRLQQDVVLLGTPRRPIPSSTAAWYTTLSGKVSRADFETLLGQPIGPEKTPRRGEFTLSSTLRDMQGSFIIRRVIKASEAKIAQGLDGADQEDPTFRMMVEVFKNTPLKNLVTMSQGSMPANLARGLVEIANGNFFKGLIAMLRKN